MSIMEFVRPDNMEFYYTTYPVIGAFWGRIFARGLWNKQIKNREKAIKHNENQNKKLHDDNRRFHSYATYYEENVRSLKDIRSECFWVFGGSILSWPFMVLVEGSVKAIESTQNQRNSVGNLASKAVTKVAIGKPAEQEFNKEAFKALEKRNAELEKELGL